MDLHRIEPELVEFDRSVLQQNLFAPRNFFYGGIARNSRYEDREIKITYMPEDSAKCGSATKSARCLNLQRK